MKTWLLKLIFPWLKKIIIGQLKNRQPEIVNMILKKIGNKIPLSGEQEEYVLNVLYDAAEEIIENELKNIEIKNQTI